VSIMEVDVPELSEFFGSLVQDVMKDHEKRFADRVRAVKEASSGLHNAAAKFAKGVKNAWGTLDKTTSEYGMRLAQAIQENADRISRIQTTTSFQETERFHTEAIAALNEIITTVRRYIPKLHRALAPELAALNSALAKLENCIRALGTALDDSPGMKLESLQREVESLVERQDALGKLRREEAEENSSLEEQTARKGVLSAEKATLTSSPEFLELSRYENSLRAKEEDMRQLLQPLTKPLLKLERTLSTKKDSQIDTRTLRGIIEQPVDTLLTGQSFAVMQLIDQLETSLQLGELEVEERKRRRAEENIKAIRNGAFEQMRGDYAAVQANIQETLRQLRTKGRLEERDRLDQELAEAHAQIEKLMSRKLELENHIEELTKGISKQKDALASQLNKISHKSITIHVG
jgi:hypothetical protein